MTFKDDYLKKYFNKNLIKREISSDCLSKLDAESIFYLTQFGLPNGILDCAFDSIIKMSNQEDIKVGLMHEEILFCSKTKTIWRKDKSFFVAESIKNLIYQLFVIDYFWNIVVKNNQLGEFNVNSKIYAKFLEECLLKIDPNLLTNDNAYYWGGMLESIEFGIVS